MKKDLAQKLILLAILGFAFWILTIKINKPFWGHHDWNSVVYSNIARNYLRYGYLTTKLGQVVNVDQQKPTDFVYITHYPPLLPIFLSISFHLLGQSEMSARLTIIFFSLLLIYFIFKIGNEIGGAMLGFLASLSLILTPIFVYFGKLPVHDTIIPALSMIGFFAYIKYLRTSLKRYYALIVATIIVGGFVNWSAYYLIPALILLQLATKTPQEIRSNIYKLVPVSAVVFLAQVIHIFLLHTKSTGSIFSNVLERINPYLTSSLYGFTFAKYIKQELLFIRVYYTLPLFLGECLFISLILYNFFKNRKLSQNEWLILSLFLYGAIQLILFSQLSYIHDYMIYYLSPFMALSFAYVATKLLVKYKKSLIFPAVLIFIIYFVFLSQIKFTNALIATGTNKRGYFAGRLINKETQSGTVSFVTSNSYKEFQEVFISYYADRNVAYGENLPEGFDKKYELIIRPKDHDPLPLSEKKLLDDKYLRYEDQNFIWYKTNLKNP